MPRLSKPLIVSVFRLSTPPQITASQIPDSISLLAVMIALTPDVQAVETEKATELSP